MLHGRKLAESVSSTGRPSVPAQSAPWFSVDVSLVRASLESVVAQARVWLHKLAVRAPSVSRPSLTMCAACQFVDQCKLDMNDELSWPSWNYPGASSNPDFWLFDAFTSSFNSQDWKTRKSPACPVQVGLNCTCFKVFIADGHFSIVQHLV